MKSQRCVPAKSASEGPSKSLRRMPRILLVDDDPNSLESTRKILELAQYEVVTASDGQSALWI